MAISVDRHAFVYLGESPPVRFARLALGIAGIILVSWLGHREFRRYQARQLRKQAEETLARYDFEGSLDLYQKLQSLEPASADDHLQIARVARRAGQFELAEEHILEAQKLVGQSEASVLEQAMLHVQQGDLITFQKFLVDAIAKDPPEKALILEALARGSIEVVHLGTAMNFLNQLIDLVPDHAFALVLRGQLWDRSAHLDEAQADYRKAVDVQPDYRPARVQLAELLLRLKRGPEALEHFEILHRQDPSNWRFTLGMAACLRQEGQLDRATELLDQLLAERPNLRSVQIERAALYVDTQDAKDAESLLQKILARFPDDRDANTLMVRCLRSLGRESETNDFQERIKRFDERIRKLDEVLKSVQKAPNDPELRRQAGLLNIQLGHTEEGLRWLHGSLQINPRYQPAHATLAEFYEREGTAELAADHRRLAGKTSGGLANPLKP